MIALLAVVMLGLLLAGAPMLVPLLAGALALLLLYFAFLDPVVLVQQMIGGVQPAVLTAVPMFIFAAELMTRGRTAERLLDLVSSFVGHVPGGLPITTSVSCALFGSVSGSTQATVVAIGSPLHPRLLERGYSDAFSLALIINSSDIALLIPPSIGMIVYGVVSGTSVGELFIAGIVPGLLVLLLFSAYAYVHSLRHGIGALPRASWTERRRALRRATLPLVFPVIIIGGIYTGAFSPSEAAAVSVLYALLLEVVVFRALRPVEIPALALSAGMITAVVFILVAAGSAFSWMISYARLPELLLGGFVAVGPEDALLVLVTLSLAYFIGCMFVDPIVVILILTPIFSPAVASTGLDPVLVGVLVTLQAAIGSATPPFGCDIFTAMAIFQRSYLDTIRGTPPFLVLLLIATALLIAFPALSLGLRDLAFR